MWRHMDAGNADRKRAMCAIVPTPARIPPKVENHGCCHARNAAKPQTEKAMADSTVGTM